MIPSLPFWGAADPLKQFEITKLFDFQPGGYELSFTNSAAYMLLACGLVILFMGLAASRGEMVPGRLQSLGELTYNFVADMIRSTAGEEGLRFFPFVFSLFTFILFANMIGMFPYAFTVTSHIAVTGALAILVILIVIGYGIYKNGLGFFRLFAPAGAPALAYVILIPIEIVSFLARPLTLGMRLFGNMLAGHIMLKLLVGFAVTMFGIGGGITVLSIAPFFLSLLITALEFLVSFIQAYVFALLTCVYLSDALHPSH